MNQRRAFSWVLMLTLLLVLTGAHGVAFALVREGKIEGTAGLSFKNIVYNWNSLLVDIINPTSANIDFGGTMVFLNRYGKPIARAEILPLRLKRRSSHRCLGNFVLGSGEEAQSATRLIWEFSPHRPQQTP
ncbi:MAG: hypothetical protein GX256_07955 [Fretibacterium sp.]|nr:hypothetical protein [Fretibacterium sp.]